MKNLLLLLICIALIVHRSDAQGFSGIVELGKIPISEKTADKTQAKVWSYDGKWWSVLASGNATKIFRLDGTAWIPILTLASTNSRADCRVVGNVVHFLLFKGASKNALIVSAEYDDAANTYKLWSKRPGAVSLLMPSSSVSASLIIDGNNRMWVASNTVNSMVVWWSDSPFTSWSSAVTLATGTLDDDVCAITAIPAQNKIAVLWSNKNTKRFGFKTHKDGDNPATWSADEIPASQSANDNIGAGMADNHLDMKVAADGTLYCAARTSYGKTGYPQLILLVRRPSGSWDDVYPVTMNPEGTQGILLFNETLGKLKVVYNTATNGNILYRESGIETIAFGGSAPLISGGTNMYNSPTSTHQNYSTNIVVMATDAGVSPWQATSVLASDAAQTDETPPTVTSINRYAPLTQSIQTQAVTFRVLFSEGVSNVDAIDFTLAVLNGDIQGQISNVSKASTNNTTYDVTVSSLTGTGTFRLDLKAAGTNITDASGNAIASGYTSGQTYIIQQDAPVLTTVEIASDNASQSLAKVNDKVTLSFTASEPINAPVVKIAGHSVAAVAGSNNTYTATYTLTSSDAEGKVSFSIDFSNKNGVAGEQVTSTTDNSSVTFDKTNPQAQSINRKTPSTSTISVSNVTYNIQFTEAVTGVDINDFVLTKSGATQGAIASVSGSKDIYDVVVNNISGNGTLRLDLKASGTNIADPAGNLLTNGLEGQTYTYQQATGTPSLNGFATITKLTPLPINISTAHKPQHKVWNYDNRWWAVLSTSSGTNIYRLDGTSWTFILKLASTTSARADVRIVGNLVHLLLFRGASSISYIASVEYDATAKTYKFWNQRKSLVNIPMPDGAEAATLEVDGNQRLWVAYDAITDIYVQWSAAPYTTWSAPIKIASGVKSDDICSITRLPGKIGVFWSNQNTRRFGFKTHLDGASPSTWSGDELPASQSAIDNIGAGLADDHMNIKVGADGTLYCAAKTGYNKTGYPQLILLVRRPNGSWDNVYPVTFYPEGTQAMAVLNESKGTLKVVYTITETGGDILYRETLTSNIAFTASKKLISEQGVLFNHSTTTYEGYNPAIVILASRFSPTPMQAHGVLASDEALDNNTIIASASNANSLIDAAVQQNDLQMVPNPLQLTGNLHFKLNYAGKYTIVLYDSKGVALKVLKEGFADANVPNSIKVDGSAFTSGVYFIHLQTEREVKAIKVIKAEN